MAGSSTGYSGDGGDPENATLHSPYQIVLTDDEDLYIADRGNHCIRKIDSILGYGSPIISTVAGTGTSGSAGDGGAATSARLNNPTGIALDQAGNLYIADTSNNKIRKVNSSGIISTFAGTGTGSFSGDGGQATSATLWSPGGLGIFEKSYADNSEEHFLYIADEYNHRIRRIDLTTGIITTVAGTGTSGYSGDGGQATSAKLNYPSGTAVNSVGDLFIADRNNSTVRKVYK